MPLEHTARACAGPNHIEHKCGSAHNVSLPTNQVGVGVQRKRRERGRDRHVFVTNPSARPHHHRRHLQPPAATVTRPRASATPSGRSPPRSAPCCLVSARSTLHNAARLRRCASATFAGLQYCNNPRRQQPTKKSTRVCKKKMVSGNRAMVQIQYYCYKSTTNTVPRYYIHSPAYAAKIPTH